MAKKKTFKRTIALSPAEVHGVLSSEDYLLNVKQPEDGSTVEMIDSQVDRDEQGRVTAKVEVEITPAEAAAEGAEAVEQVAEGEVPAEQGADEDGAGSDQGGAGSEKKGPMRFQQTTVVDPMDGETCTAETAMPLPQGLGEMRMHFTYTPKRNAPETSDVKIVVSVEVNVPVPLVGGMVARKILGTADETIDKGLARIEKEGLARRES